MYVKSATTERQSARERLYVRQRGSAINTNVSAPETIRRDAKLAASIDCSPRARRDNKEFAANASIAATVSIAVVEGIRIVESGERCIVGKRHAIPKRLVYRTALYDFCQAFALRVVHIALDLNVAGDFVNES